jgi:hypothetical protein
VAIDPVSRKAFQTPLFIAGVLMLVAGLVPVGVGVMSGWNGISGVSFLSVFAPVGALLMALARSKASHEWKQGRQRR